MIWEKPAVLEIKMDAEIGSYQLDAPEDDAPLFVEANSAKRAEPDAE